MKKSDFDTNEQILGFKYDKWRWSRDRQNKTQFKFPHFETFKVSCSTVNTSVFGSLHSYHVEKFQLVQIIFWGKSRQGAP